MVGQASLIVTHFELTEYLSNSAFKSINKFYFLIIFLYIICLWVEIGGTSPEGTLTSLISLKYSRVYYIAVREFVYVLYLREDKICLLFIPADKMRLVRFKS